MSPFLTLSVSSDGPPMIRVLLRYPGTMVAGFRLLVPWFCVSFPGTTGPWSGACRYQASSCASVYTQDLLVVPPPTAWLPYSQPRTSLAPNEESEDSEENPWLKLRPIASHNQG